jgi:hypothetical protein
MPNTYTQEQIAADLATVSAYIENGSPLPELEDDPYWKASSASERLGGIVSALSTAEQERDAYRKASVEDYAKRMEAEGNLAGNNAWWKKHTEDDRAALVRSAEKAESERDEYAKAIVNSAKIAAKAEGQVKLLKAKVAELEARLQGAGWISVEERLPEALERVLVFYVNDLGKNRIDIGQHIPSKTVLAEDFLDENAEGCSEYDSGNDCYWVIEGWWEDLWQAEINYKIHDAVTHWTPLPEPPVGKEGEE